jgi:hypothetical protein
MVAGSKRRLSGSFSSEPLEGVATKKRRLEGHIDAANDEFIGDLHAQHPAHRQEMPKHFLCPISYDVMRDPVLVTGSGNTYDRKSIERHFQIRHTDPLTNVELRRSSERKLVDNNALRSQIREAERDQVDLRLVASLGEPSIVERSSGPCEGSVLSPMRWYASKLLWNDGGP